MGQGRGTLLHPMTVRETQALGTSCPPCSMPAWGVRSRARLGQGRMPGKCWKRSRIIIIFFIPIIPAIPGQVLYKLLQLFLKDPVAFFFLNFFPRHPCLTASGQPEWPRAEPGACLKFGPTLCLRCQYLQSCVVVVDVAGDEAALLNDCSIQLGLGSGFIEFPTLSGSGTGWWKKTHKKKRD